MLGAVAVWLASFSLMYCSRTEPTAEFWARFGFLGIVAIPASVYQFTTLLLRKFGRKKFQLAAVWIFSIVWAVIAVSTPYLVSGVTRYSFGWYPNLGPIAPIFVLWLFVVLSGNLLEYYGEYKRTDSLRRRSQLRSLAASFVIVYLATIDLAPMFGLEMRPVGFIAIIAFLLYASRAIVRHRLAVITPARAAREIIATLADALFVCDAEGKIRLTNQAVNTLLGYHENELLGKGVDTVSDPDSSSSLTELIGTHVVRDREHRLVHRGGRLIDVSLSISPLMEGSEESGAVLLARDIRERKAAEVALRDFAEKLQHSNRELEDFAHVASHDLQEPLRKIQAFGDRLRSVASGTLTAEGTEYVERMQSAAKRMQILISDLLAFSRVTTKGQPFVPVSLEQIVSEILSDLEVSIASTSGRVEVEDLPIVTADPLQMRQLMQNLIGNALKFHKPGIAPLVRVYAVPGIDSHGREATELRVEDNGIGFEEKYLDRIFTVFQRLHGRSEFEGTGVGLAICRKIAERHGGEITARSQPGVGSTFVVSIPLAPMKE